MPAANHASVTTLRDFLECRRRGRFQSVWQSKSFAPALFFGSAIHAGLEGYYFSGRNTTIGDQMFAKFCADEGDKYSRLFGERWENEWPAFDETYKLAWRVLQNYWDAEKYVPLEGQIIMTEKYLKFELAGSGLFLSGKIDLVIRDADGQLWVVDHKTTSERLNEASLEVDEQLTGYVYLVFRQLGELPAGVIYNSVLKKAPDVPIPTKTGLSKAKGQLTSPALYRQALAERGLDEAEYADFLHYLETDGWATYISRDKATRNMIEVQNFEKYAARKVKDITDSLNGSWDVAYPSASIYRCGYCPFIAPCKAMSDGGDWMAILNEKFARY